MLIVLVWSAPFFMAGMRVIWMFGLAGVAGVGLLVAYSTVPHVASRIQRFLNPASGDTFNIDIATESFMRGGCWNRWQELVTHGCVSSGSMKSKPSPAILYSWAAAGNSACCVPEAPSHCSLIIIHDPFSFPLLNIPTRFATYSLWLLCVRLSVCALFINN